MEEIVIQTNEDNLLIIVLENEKIVELYERRREDLSKIGNIYLGRIKDILYNSNALFVDYGEEKAGFLQLKSLENEYKVGDKILVQVKKDEIGQKGAKLTNEISLAHRSVALLKNKEVFTISRKIQDNEATNELLNKLQQYRDRFGIILRSDAENSSYESIISQIEALIKKYDEIEKEFDTSDDIKLLYNANLISKKIFDEFCKEKTKKIYINNKEIFDDIKREENEQKGFLKKEMPEIIFDENADFIEKFGLYTELEKAHQNKIWLKSGGYIVIEKTEALTAIDVNSGKFVGNSHSDNLDKFILSTNIEATIEVAKQIRLKNIGGIILVDFINMKSDEDKEQIISILNEEIKKDRSRVEVYEFTHLGLLEIARKKL